MAFSEKFCPCGCGNLKSRLHHGGGKKCECGCGQMTNRVRKKANKFINGHGIRKDNPFKRYGDDHYLSWDDDADHECACGCGTIIHGRRKFAPGHYQAWRKRKHG